jgi:hypothetical protein
MGKLERLNDDDVERLLTGTSNDGDLSDLRSVIDVLRAGVNDTVSESVIGEYVDATVTAALRPSERSKRSIPLPTPRHVRLLRRPAVVGFISMLTLVVGMSGVAWAANSSKPGDSFYSLDRAFEAIGIGNGGAAERFSEIRALFDAGDLSRMLDHVTHVIPRNAIGTGSAVVALRAAALSVPDRSTPATTETISAVSKLLDYLSENLTEVDAAEITTFAGHIRTRGFASPDAGLTPADPTDPSGFKEDG